MDNKLLPAHPGEILLHEFMEPYGLTVEVLAERLNVSHWSVRALIDRQTWISVDWATRLARYFGTEVELWLNLERNFDMAEYANRPEHAEATSLKQHSEYPARAPHAYVAYEVGLHGPENGRTPYHMPENNSERTE